jgi:cyclophilin family peptidyl-prolyl cis-trans isomerase
MKRLLILVLFVLAVAFSAAGGDNPKVILETSKGNIVLELYADKAQETVRNFLSYVDTISEVKTVTSGRFRDVPAEPVIITRADRLPCVLGRPS